MNRGAAVLGLGLLAGCPYDFALGNLVDAGPRLANWPEDTAGPQCSQKGNGDYVSCSTSVDCQCPLLCGLDSVLGADDAGGSICVTKCSTTSECPDIFTSCQNGLCLSNICEADGGGGAFMGACNAAGENDGTCEPQLSRTTQEIIGVCFQAGTVDIDGGNCDPNQQAFALASAGNKKRPGASALCPVGYQCVATKATTGTCKQLCDPVFDGLSDTDAGGCLFGQDCVPIGPDTSYGGECTFQGDGGCVVGGGAGELQTCTVSSDCGCPLECEVDVNSLRHVCEMPCTQTPPGDGGCDLPYTSCQRSSSGLKYCNDNYCVQTYFVDPNPWLPDAGRYAGPCNYADAGDGICQTQVSTDPFGNPLATYGLCEPAGLVPVGGACPLSDDCGVNELCASAGGAPPVCYQFCDPRLDGGCPAGDGCFSIIPFPLTGMTDAQSFQYQVAGGCINPCSAAGATCINSSECCDGICAFVQPDAGSGSCN